MWEAHDAMGWWMLFGGGLWLVFILSVLFLFTDAFGRGQAKPDTRQEAPLEIAKRRLAGGEISHEEYERIRETLSR